MSYRLFFSPTGGTARATELVCGAMETPFAAVDLTLPAARGQHHWFAADDLVVFGLPVYGGRLPQVPGLFDGLRGENTPAVLCACYGNRHYDDMLLEWKTEMEKRGFVCIAAAAIVIPHVYSGVLGHGRPDEADLPAIREFARAVMNKKDKTSVAVPGSFPYKNGKSRSARRRKPPAASNAACVRRSVRRMRSTTTLSVTRLPAYNA